MTEDRLDRIERAIEANARAIGALANSLQRFSETPAAAGVPIPPPLVSDPISYLKNSVDSLSLRLEELESDLNGFASERDTARDRSKMERMAKELHFEEIDMEKCGGFYELHPDDRDERAWELFAASANPYKETKIEEFDRRLKELENRVSFSEGGLMALTERKDHYLDDLSR